MSLIEFKNLPNTSTPITAENLNNNFNEAKKHEIATAYLTSSQGNLGVGLILLDNIQTNTDKLTLSNNAILIGDGISKIKVSANVFGEIMSTTDYLWCEIRKNGTAFIRGIDNSNTTYAGVSFAPILIDVQEGDYIQLFKAGTTNAVTIRGYNQNTYNTYLTVEVVE